MKTLMKHRFEIVFAALFAALSFPLPSTATTSSAPQLDTVRILAIGNSFSRDALDEHFNELADAAGVYVVVGDMYIGGCSLERHWGNVQGDKADYTYYKRCGTGPLKSEKGYTLARAVKDEQWDVVTFQQASVKSFDADTFEPYLGSLVEWVKANTRPGVRFMWHQTWAYPNHTVKAVLSEAGGQKEMYRKIAEISEQVCNKYGFGIIPTGTAVQNARSSFIGDNLNRDTHLNFTVGRYVAACTWLEAVLGINAEGNSYLGRHMQPFHKDVLQAAAHLACAEPYAVTNMKPLGYGCPAPNYDEALVPSYTLPDALTMADGTPVRNKKQWETARRPELLELFTTQMFGKAPAAPELKCEVLSERKDALGGKATRKEVRIRYADHKYAYLDLLVYTPNAVKQAPMFLGVNFKGNYAVTDETDVAGPNPKGGKYGILENRKRGVAVSRWPLEKIIDAGFGVATFYRGDVAPDFVNSFNIGVQNWIGKHYPEADEWGCIAAWSWGLSRAMDYLVTDPAVDGKRIAVIGHSRLGKAALWAGACDERFAMVVSNCSGCCGAALSRRAVGETVQTINMTFPHWFCDNFKAYMGKEDALPFDQHELLALIAPRPLFVGSARGDIWADPEGERLSLEAARDVYKRLYGKKAAARTAYFCREGKHDITAADWQRYLDFARKNIGR